MLAQLPFCAHSCSLQLLHKPSQCLFHDRARAAAPHTLYEVFKLKETAANQFPTQQMPSPNEIHTHAHQDLKYAMYSTSSLLDKSIRIKGIWICQWPCFPLVHGLRPSQLRSLLWGIPGGRERHATNHYTLCQESLRTLWSDALLY